MPCSTLHAPLQVRCFCTLHPPTYPAQEFLGLVEIRFLDDMRRRTSYIQPYELGAGGGFLVAPSRAAPASYSDALEGVHVERTAAGCQTAAIQALADKVEVLQVCTCVVVVLVLV